MKKIDKIIASQPVSMGGRIINQPLPTNQMDMLDPFVLIHHAADDIKEGFDHKTAGVGPHPHSGFSPVTFIFKGSVRHRDSIGNDQMVHSGGTQWMHSGKGVIHSERPGEDLQPGMQKEIIQFWVNSPKKHKNDAPSYLAIDSEMTPVKEKNGARIELVAGNFEGMTGPGPNLSPQTLLRIETEPGADFEFEIPESFNTLAYVLEGKAQINAKEVEPENMMVFKREGTTIKITSEEKTRLIILSGEPLNEPVVSYGPFVMNSKNEIMQAIEDSQSGKMGTLVE